MLDKIKLWLQPLRNANWRAMRKLLQDRVIIVLGVGPALGHSTAMMCTEEGASVVLAARGQEMLDTVAADVEAKGGTALTVAMDMTISADCKRLVTETVQRFGRVDGLVCIAYKHHDSKLITESDDDLAYWRSIMDVNFFGTMLVIKQVIGQMSKQGDGGSIVIINSMNSHNPWPRTLPYSAAKAALASAARVLAVEYGDQGIRAFNLQPGPVKTERLLQDMAGFGFNADNWAPPEVIGEVVLWLATQPGAAALNGQCIQGQEFCVEHDLVPGWKPQHAMA